MDFNQLQQAVETASLENSLQMIKEFTLHNIGHLPSRLLHAQVLQDQISDLIQYNQNPLAFQIELLSLVEQILDLDPENKDIIVNWLSLQVAFNFEQTDLDRYHNYLDFLKQDRSFYQKGILYQIDFLLFQDNKQQAIELYLDLIDFSQTIEDRLQRDFYVSLYLYYAVYYLTDQQVNQITQGIDLIQKHVGQLTYQDVYPIYYMLSVALDHNEMDLIDQLALQLIGTIQNNSQVQSYDSNLEELLVYLLDNHTNTEAIIHAYLSLQYRMYGERKWELELERLYQNNPNSNYLKGALATLLMQEKKYGRALDLLKVSLFQPVVGATFYADYLVCYYRVHGEFPVIDLSKITANPIKLIDNSYVLEQLAQELKGNQLQELRDIQLALYFLVEQLFDNYLNQNQYVSSALMYNHGIAQIYHNMACFILDNKLEYLYPKAIQYSDKSREFSFFYYQLSLRCNLYKALGENELFLQAIQEYLSYPIFECDPSDYFRFKLQLATVLINMDQKQQAITTYKQVKQELIDYFRESGISEFNEDYLVHAFEADDTLMPYLPQDQQELIYTRFEYFQFFPKNIDVLYRLALAYYQEDELGKFEIYSDHYFNAYSELDYMWNQNFYHIMELYIPVCYKTSPEHVADWLEMLEKYNADVPWLDSYIKTYKSAPQKGGFFKNLFK
ncbi:hypothetical protein [Myroides sp. LJL119]